MLHHSYESYHCLNSLCRLTYDTVIYSISIILKNIQDLIATINQTWIRSKDAFFLLMVAMHEGQIEDEIQIFQLNKL